MNEENLSIYRNLKRAGKHNAAQKMGEKCFSAYLLHLAGSKFLLHKLIQLPILAQCSAEPPASAEELWHMWLAWTQRFEEQGNVVRSSSTVEESLASDTTKKSHIHLSPPVVI